MRSTVQYCASFFEHLYDTARTYFIKNSWRMKECSRARYAPLCEVQSFCKAEVRGTHTHSACRVQRQPRKKKHSLHFWFGGGEISFEKGRGVFLSGFCPPSIRTVGVQMQFGLVFAKLFCGRKGSQKRDWFFETAGFGFPPRRRVREECAADFFWFSVRPFARWKKSFC